MKRWQGVRSVLALAAFLIAAALMWQVVSASLTTGRALRVAKAASEAAQAASANDLALRNAAIARINGLSAEIDALNTHAGQNATLIGRLVAEVKALDVQVAQLGGVPVVVETVTVSPPAQSTAKPTGHPSPSAAPSSPRASASASPSHSPSPVRPSPTPSPFCLLPGVCL